ncbi:hypothetical protein D3C80_1516140 [compost metagenome]
MPIGLPFKLKVRNALNASRRWPPETSMTIWLSPRYSSVSCLSRSRPSGIAVSWLPRKLRILRLVRLPMAAGTFTSLFSATCSCNNRLSPPNASGSWSRRLPARFNLVNPTMRSTPAGNDANWLLLRFRYCSRINL